MHMIVSQITEVGLDINHLMQNEVECLDTNLNECKTAMKCLQDLAETNHEVKVKLHKMQDQMKTLDAQLAVEDEIKPIKQHLDMLTSFDTTADELLSKSIVQAKRVAAQPGFSNGICDVYEDSLQLANDLKELKKNAQKKQEVCRAVLETAPAAHWQEYLQQIGTHLLENVASDYAGYKMLQTITIFYKPVLERLASISAEQEIKQKSSQMLQTVNERKNIGEQGVRIWQIQREYMKAYLQCIEKAEIEMNALQKVYVHLKRLPQLQQSVNRVSVSLVEGEMLLQQLQKHLKEQVLPICDKKLCEEIKAEDKLLQARFDKLNSAVQAQQETLRQIQELYANYELLIVTLQTTFYDIESLLQKVTHAELATDVDEYLQQCEKSRVKLLSIKNQEIKQLRNLEGQLNAYLSEVDKKAIRQQIWLLEQHLYELDYQLLAVINSSTERMGSLQKLNKSIEELSEKLQKLETEIVEGSIEDEQLSDELLLHEKECEWLQKSVENLPENIKEKVFDVNAQYAHVQQLSKQRTDRYVELQHTLLRLEERTEALYAWLYEIELELNKPLSFESYEDQALRKKLKHNEQIQRSIEQQSGNVGELLNLMELVLTDTKSASVLAKSKDLESRWKQVCSGSTTRRQRITTLWEILQELHSYEIEHSTWLKETYTQLEKLEHNVDNLPEQVANDRLKLIKSKFPELQTKQAELLKLQQIYRDFTLRQDVDQEKMSPLINGQKLMISKWTELLPRYQALMIKLDSSEKYRQELLQAQSVIMSLLSSIQTEITQLDLTQAEQALKRLKKLQQFKCKEAASKIQAANEFLQNVESKDFATEYYVEIREGKTQYDNLWQALQKDILEIETKLKKEIKTSTEITAKETYKMELLNAIEICKQHFEELRKTICDKTCLPGPQRINKLLTNAKTSTETIRHLSRKLIEEHAANNNEAQVETVAELILQYDTLESQWKTRKQHEQSRR